MAGQLPPAPLLSTVNSLDGVAAALPEYGESALLVVALPHPSGFANSAFGPPLKLSLSR